MDRESKQAGKSPKPNDVVLLCNPLAGGRWRALADVLDSDEAKGVRRIVTDEIDDVAAALSDVGQRARLLCVYGGDGTIYHVINELLRHGHEKLPRLAFLGGGTMNVTGRLYGMTGSPADNFRAAMQGYMTDQLRWRDVPVLKVQQDGSTCYGFTFGMGPLVRLLDRYERGGKGKLSAVAIGARAIAAAISPFRTAMSEILDDMPATVHADGELLPHDHFAAVFANTTGTIQRLVEPFAHTRMRDTFHFLAYAISTRELAMNVPGLMRGKLPIDPRALLEPKTVWKALRGEKNGKPDLPRDPRYINHPAQHVIIKTDEAVYTLDGEVLPHSVREGAFDSEHILDVSLGPSLQIALGPTAT